MRQSLLHKLTFSLLFIFFAFTFTSTAFAQSWEELAGSATGGGVSNNAGSSAYPSLALDSNGNPHITWTNWSGSNHEIYYAYWDGTGWATRRNTNTGGGVSNNTGNSQNPSLALDNLGNPHIAWAGISGNSWEAYYAYWDGSGWATYGGANGGGGVSNNAGTPSPHPLPLTIVVTRISPGRTVQAAMGRYTTVTGILMSAYTQRTAPMELTMMGMGLWIVVTRTVTATRHVTVTSHPRLQIFHVSQIAVMRR